MQRPTIHSNGTSRDALLADYRNALNALREARAKLQDAAPNGRDYYPQGNEAIVAASREHRARMAKLEEVTREITEIGEAVATAPGREPALASDQESPPIPTGWTLRQVVSEFVSDIEAAHDNQAFGLADEWSDLH